MKKTGPILVPAALSPQHVSQTVLPNIHATLSGSGYLNGSIYVKDEE